MTATTSSQWIDIPGAPALPGLRFRNYQGESDLPGMAAVINAAWKADHNERIYTPNELAADNLPSPNFDPFKDILIAEVNGTMIAHSRTRWWVEQAEPNCFLHSYGFVRPDWRHKGLGKAMLAHNLAHLRQIASRLEEKYPRSQWHYAFDSYATSFETGNQALLRQTGYTAIRQSYIMLRPDLDHIPDAPLPEGIEVRPARPEHYRQIWDASQEAFRDHWGYSEPSEADYQGWLKTYEFQPELWQVAWEGDQVAGMVLNFINQHNNETFGQKRGWTEGISVRRPWRQRGLARALLARSLALLREQGMREAALGVDAENPNGAVHLYESMGYRTFRVLSTYRKPL